jgi:RNA polymerase sigma-70 factor (ECF subfamily)
MRKPEPVTLAHDPPARERTDADAERKRLGAAIAAGIGELPDAQRAVLVLREYHELDYQEIAEALEIDVGTVKSRLSRARTALREYLTRSL